MSFPAGPEEVVEVRNDPDASPPAEGHDRECDFREYPRGERQTERKNIRTEKTPAPRKTHVPTRGRVERDVVVGILQIRSEHKGGGGDNLRDERQIFDGEPNVRQATVDQATVHDHTVAAGPLLNDVKRVDVPSELCIDDRELAPRQPFLDLFVEKRGMFRGRSTDVIRVPNARRGNQEREREPMQNP
jgi:hypothetical protein